VAISIQYDLPRLNLGHRAQDTMTHMLQFKSRGISEKKKNNEKFNERIGVGKYLFIKEKCT
jgi:hypothetical protein